MTPYCAVPRDVVREDEAQHGFAVGSHEGRRYVVDRVAVNRHVGGALPDLEACRLVAAPIRWSDVVEQVVANADPLSDLAARCLRTVVSENVEGAGRVPDDVVRERDVAYGGPGHFAGNVARREHDGVTRLVAAPVVLEPVAVNRHPLPVLELQEILRNPSCRRRPLVCRCSRPRQCRRTTRSIRTS